MVSPRTVVAMAELHAAIVDTRLGTCSHEINDVCREDLWQSFGAWRLGYVCSS